MARFALLGRCLITSHGGHGCARASPARAAGSIAPESPELAEKEAAARGSRRSS